MVLPTTPRDAATVVLLRDGTDGLEVWMLRRVPTMAFAPGMHVFPGGAVEDADRRDAAALPLLAGDDTAGPAGWAAAFGTDAAGAGALLHAAVRETFEETGVLLAAGPGGATPAAHERDRADVLERRRTVVDLLLERRAAVAVGAMAPWAHWVTPEHEPRRYDTRFLVAALPAGQEPRDVAGEADRVGWVTPGAALRAHAAGALPMLPPTRAVLAELASYGDVAAVLATARTRRISRVLPRPAPGGSVPAGEQAGRAVPPDRERP